MKERKHPSSPTSTGGESDALLGDLEQIRDLLDEDLDEDGDEGSGEHLAGTKSTDDEQVPLLDDVIGGGMQVVEESFDREPALERTPGASVLSQATFDALLGDSWKNDTDAMLKEARKSIHDPAGASHAPGESIAPIDPIDPIEQIEPTNEALEARIDAAIGTWLRELVDRHIDELRVVLARELGAARAPGSANAAPASDERT